MKRNARARSALLLKYLEYSYAGYVEDTGDWVAPESWREPPPSTKRGCATKSGIVPKVSSD